MTDLEMTAVNGGEKQIAETKYTEDEMAQIKAVSERIDLTDSNAIISYGTSAQRKVSDFADSALASVRAKDMGETGELLSKLLIEIKHNGEERKGFFGRLFDRGSKKIDEVQAQFRSTEGNVDKLVELLEDHQQQLVKDIAQLDILFDKNKQYFKEVSMYIEAGKMKLDKARTEELPALRARADSSGAPEDAQTAQDYANLIERFDKKLYDLELSRTVCLQTAPEIRAVQDSDTIMAEKIHSTIINVIPMWKTQMVLALNNFHTQSAIKAQNDVTEATNEMLRRNAEMLHQNVVDTAAATERGIVDIETLKNTNQQLIQALDDIQKVQEEGITARANAEKELISIEAELKQKMIEISSRAGRTAEEIEEAGKAETEFRLS